MENLEIVEEVKKEKPKKRRRTKAIVLSILVGLVFIGIFLIPIGLFIGAIFSPGYNSIMYRTLSNPKLYQTRVVIIENVTAYDKWNRVKEFPQNASDDIDTVVLEVKYLNYVPALNYENKLRVEIVGENIDVLLESDFFIEYNAGDYIDIKYANFTYMDTDFFYVASLSYQDKDYLTFEVGLNNIIALMDEHRSLL